MLAPFIPGERLDGALNLGEGDRFGQMHAESRFPAPADILRHAEAAEGDAGEIPLLAEREHQVDSAPIRQTDIADHHVDLAATRRVERGADAGGGHHVMPGLAQQQLQHLPGIMMVIHQQDVPFHIPRDIDRRRGNRHHHLRLATDRIEKDGEDRSLVGPITGHVDASSVKLGQRPGDRQPEAESAESPTLLPLLPLHERLEDLLHQLRLDADPGIAHIDS